MKVKIIFYICTIAVIIYLLTSLNGKFEFDIFFLLCFLISVLIAIIINKYKLIFIPIYSFFLLLFAGEEYLYFKNINKQKARQDIKSISKIVAIDGNGNIDNKVKTLSSRNQILGYGARPGYVLTDYLEENGKIIKDVKYTINHDGLRITSKYEKKIDDTAKNCVFIFGDSIAYGTNLSDEETLPYMIGEKLENNVYNLAYGGYGPHQMYSYIISGKLKDITRCSPSGSIAFFITNYDHPNRSAGYREWNKYEAKYEVIHNSLVNVGTFEKYEFPINFKRKLNFYKKFSELVSDSLLLTMISKLISTFDDYDINRYIMLIERSSELLHSDYGVSEFYILYYDQYGGFKNNRILKNIYKRNLNIIKVTDIIHDIRDHYTEYVLFDDHPNEKTNQLLANWILDNILNDQCWVKNSH